MRKREGISDTELEQVMGDFRRSVVAWSEKQWHDRASQASATPRRPIYSFSLLQWGLATAVALVVAAVPLLRYDMLRNQEHMPNAALQHVVEVPVIANPVAASTTSAKRQSASRSEKEEARFFADVDADISRSTPHAMQPLADLMSSSSQENASNEE